MNKHNLNWQTWLKNGDQYLKAATPKGTKSRFGADIRYNLLSMSLEGYIMAILDFHHNLPDNHTYFDLIYGLERVMPIDETLKKRILQYENILIISDFGEEFYILLKRPISIDCVASSHYTEICLTFQQGFANHYAYG